MLQSFPKRLVAISAWLLESMWVLVFWGREHLCGLPSPKPCWLPSSFKRLSGWCHPSLHLLRESQPWRKGLGRKQDSPSNQTCLVVWVIKSDDPFICYLFHGHCRSQDGNGLPSGWIIALYLAKQLPLPVTDFSRGCGVTSHLTQAHFSPPLAIPYLKTAEVSLSFRP